MRVAILTFHKCINYGSYWQAACLADALRKRGHTAEILDHDCRFVRRAEARCAFQPKLPEPTPRQELPHYRAKTRRFIEAFNRLPLSRTFPLQKPELTQHYDAIVVGSDEVWNFRHPWYGSKPIFFGDGLRTQRLVSYGASFGNHSAWDGIHPDWARKLSRFSSLSVRDENSWHLVRNGTGRDPELVLDPCLLNSGPAQASAPDVQPYALVYGYGFPEWLKKLASAWSRRTGVRLVSVGYSNDFADEQRIAAGPLEFARLMSGARAVITNFFHGCVFALLHGKPWATTPSDYRSIKIPNLAATLATSHRLIDDETGQRAFERLMETPVESAVGTRLTELRNRSQDYLDAALA